jgi:hypothetical protein
VIFGLEWDTMQDGIRFGGSAVAIDVFSAKSAWFFFLQSEG